VIIGLPKGGFAPAPAPRESIVDLMWFTDDLGRGWQRRATGELTEFVVPTYRGSSTVLPSGLDASRIGTGMNSEAARLSRGAVTRDAADCSEAT
jgi:hypothetical protein